MYTCGITPYDSTHLGHAATYLGYDVLQRRLRDLGHETRCVRNITDVDDSILGKAREIGVHYLDLAAAEMARFDGDMERLDMIPPWSEPRATSAIADIRGFIGMVLDQGFAYQAGGAVYFEVARFPKFGQVSHFSRDEMLAFAAERGGNVDDPAQARPARLRPLAAVAARRAGVGVAVGPGPAGLAHRVLGAVPPRARHHDRPPRRGSRPRSSRTTSARPPSPRRRPVSRWCATGCTRRWSRMDGEKMSKSLGNLVFVSDLAEEFDSRAIRLGVIAHHYREAVGVEHRDHADRGRSGWARWNANGAGSARARRGAPGARRRLSTPEAIDAIDVAVSKGLGVSEAAALLGVDLSRRQSC